MSVQQGSYKATGERTRTNFATTTDHRCDNRDDRVADETWQRAHHRQVGERLLLVLKQACREDGLDGAVTRFRDGQAAFLVRTQPTVADDVQEKVPVGHGGHRGFSDASATASQQGPAGRCYCCGYEGHYAKDKSCPGRGKECTKCGRMGHFSACCKTKMEPHGQNSNKKGTVRNVEYEEQQDGEYDLYSFSVLNTVSPAEET